MASVVRGAVRYEVHLIHAPVESHAALVRLARGEAAIDEPALVATMRPDAAPQVVARFASSRAAERLQGRLTDLGCAATVVDRGSAVSRFIDRTFGGSDEAAPTNGAVMTKTTVTTADDREDARTSGSTMLRQDPALRRAAEKSAAVQQLRRRLLGAVLGLVCVAAVMGALALVSDLVSSTSSLGPETVDENGNPRSSSAAGRPAPMQATTERAADEAERPPSESQGERPEAEAAAQEEASRPEPAAQPREASAAAGPEQVARNEAAEPAARATTIVGRASVFLVGLLVGFGLLYGVRRLTDPLPVWLRRLLIGVTAAAVTSVALAAALVQLRVSGTRQAEPSPDPTAIDAPGPAAGIPTHASEGSGPTVRAFVAALEPPVAEPRFGLMAEQLLAPPAPAEGSAAAPAVADGSGEPAEVAEGSGLVPADDDLPADLADGATGRTSVATFVQELPASEAACDIGAGEFARIACALRDTTDAEPGGRVELAVREPAHEGSSPTRGGSETESQPAIGSTPGEEGESDRVAEAVAADDPHASGAAAMPSAETAHEDPAAAPAPRATAREHRDPVAPERGPYLAAAASGTGTGVALELICVPLWRRRRRSP